jgi:hypothetical protein
MNASLSRLLLFIAATSDPQAGILVNNVIAAMRTALRDDLANPARLQNFEMQLRRLADPGNMHILRAAVLEFLFNYKWTLNYPNDFVPYDLRISAHALNDIFQPINEAFNRDIDQYVQDKLDDRSLIPKTNRAGLISQGMVQVAALSGTTAMVSGQISNYFNITQTPAASQVAQALFGSSAAGGGSGGSGGPGGAGGGAAGAAAGVAAATTTPPSGSSGSGGGSGSGGAAGGAASLQSLMASNPYVLGGVALANMLSPPKIIAQLTKGVTLTITPTSLDTASSAELNVSLLVNEPDGAPQSVNSSAATQDTLDRVATHAVSDIVRVQSLKLFDLSTLSMEITHPLTPTCVPMADDGAARVASYIAAVPFSVPCAVWRSVFGSMPIAGRLFEWPRSPITVDNRSLAIVRAVVVPTSMDLGEALNYESDRIYDPITRTTQALSSIQQLGWRARQYHRLKMQCMVRDTTAGCWRTLSDTPEDGRNPNTN